jgi:DNA-binding FadR family transcriptional regulator
MRHSGGKRVLDFRRAAGLELLPTLLVARDGRIDAAVVRSVMEMRSAIGPDVVRLAARRRDRLLTAALRESIEKMEAAGGDLAALQDLADEFWSRLVDGSRNVAYRLAYNSLRASYDRGRRLVTHVLATEIADVEAYRDIAAAVTRGEGEKAETLARRLLRRGEQSIDAALEGDERASRGKRR